MTTNQIASILTPLFVGAAAILVHFLSGATIAEIAMILGVIINALTAVRNVFVPSPSQVKVAAAVAKVVNSCLVLLVFAVFLVSFLGYLDGCTAADETTEVRIVDAVCLDIEAAASVIPPGSIQEAAADIGAVCTNVPLPAIVAFLQNLFAGQADAGVVAATVYTPSPHALQAKAAARVKAFGAGK